jgi:ribosomal-protein-alanine N-acetyltransferase
VGYWIDQALAGQGYVPEAAVVLFRYAFEELGLHRLQISIIPRNRASRRVAEKLGLRDEGTALRYLQIYGRWEDHVRYAITTEDWAERRDAYRREWMGD